MPLYEKIYQHLLNEIRSGVLKSGDRVPSEHELAEQFEVSRITTKKALELLANAGYVERIQGKGSYVSEHLPSSMGKPASSNGLSRANGVSGRKSIGLILPDISESFGLRLFRAIEDACHQSGSNLWIRLTNDDQKEEEDAIRQFTNSGIHGLIILPVHGEHYSEELLRLVLNDAPLVIVDRYLRGIAACAVYTDNRSAAQQLTDHVLNKGHQNIALLSTRPDNTTTLEDRIAGFTNAMMMRGIAHNPDYYISDLKSTLPLSFKEENVAADRQVLRDFIERHPEVTAFLACEYNLALILQLELQQIRPMDASRYEIVCFDYPNMLSAPFKFTHIRQNEELVGTKAIELLRAQWDGQTIPLQNPIDYHLVIKE